MLLVFVVVVEFWFSLAVSISTFKYDGKGVVVKNLTIYQLCSERSLDEFLKKLQHILKNFG